MASSNKDNVLAVLSLSGGNDGLSTVVPYTDGLYRDYRPTLGVPTDQAIPLNQELGLHPKMAPLKSFWDEGKLAIFVGVGYPKPSYSHFRSMDIWHTCEPEKVGTEGWLGWAIEEIDPKHDNVLTGVNFGRGLPRALAKPGVPVASVGALETYGLLTGIEGRDQRTQALEVFAKMYGPTIGTGYTMDYIHSTGTYALKGADILATAPGKYQSTIDYTKSAVGQYMRNIVQTYLAGFGTRVLYTTSPTTGSTPMPTRPRCIRCCGPMSRPTSRVSSTICVNTRLATTSCCSCSQNSAAVSSTMVPAPTTAPPEWPSRLEKRLKEAFTVAIRR